MKQNNFKSWHSLGIVKYVNTFIGHILTIKHFIWLIICFKHTSICIMAVSFNANPFSG